MMMDATSWPDILLQGDVVTLSDIVFISIIVEGDMLDIDRVMILWMSSDLLERVLVDVGWYCLHIDHCRRGHVGYW